MQDKATNPGKINRPEKNPLDAKTTYHIGNRSFVVEPVFKKESPDTLIMIVVGIYAVLIRNISGAADIAGAIWGCMGYTVLLCFCLFKTGSISKSVFGAH